jgi:hypothetical protein
MTATNEAKASLTFDRQSVGSGIRRRGECDKASNYDDNIGPLRHRSGNLGDRCHSSMARGAELEERFKGMPDCKRGRSHSRWQNLERLSIILLVVKPKTELTDFGPEQGLRRMF